MNPQLYIGKAVPDKAHLLSIVNRPRFVKAAGGLWTSTYEPKIGSTWADWCVYNLPEWLQGKKPWLLTPRKNVRLLVIDSQVNLIEALLAYRCSTADPFLGSFSQELDYEKLAQDYDALHLTEKGQRETHLPFIHSAANLYGWDCESTHWFRWCFDDVREVDCSWAKEK